VHYKLSAVFSTRRVKMRNRKPLISFAFDDFPRSAADTAASILDGFGVRATYYTSLGLMGTIDPPIGEMFTQRDLSTVIAAGHEIGCHTFAHLNSWTARHADFEESIIQNRAEMKRLFPDLSMRAFSFPHAEPRLMVKRSAARHFASCRGGGGQTFNRGVIDLKLLKGFFLEKTQGNADAVKRLIDQNRRENGWLILTTHDVHDTPSKYGCTPAFYRAVLREAVDSGARILPVSEAREVIETSRHD
jgi:peptidoglycan/xylan/chitin deacetylase (PgdA/CDA1 family)